MGTFAPQGSIAGVGVPCRPGCELGCSMHTSQSSRSFPVCCLCKCQWWPPSPCSDTVLGPSWCRPPQLHTLLSSGSLCLSGELCCGARGATVCAGVVPAPVRALIFHPCEHQDGCLARSEQTLSLTAMHLATAAFALVWSCSAEQEGPRWVLSLDLGLQWGCCRKPAKVLGHFNLLPLPCWGSKHVCAFRKSSLGFWQPRCQSPWPSNLLKGTFPPSLGPQEWGAQYVVQTPHSPGMISEAV